MATTTLHTRARTGVRTNHVARPKGIQLRENYLGLAKKARRSYQRASRMVRVHPRSSLAILIGIGLVTTGLLVGLVLKSRIQPRQYYGLWPS